MVLDEHAQVDRMCSRLKHICGAEGITVNRQVRHQMEDQALFQGSGRSFGTHKPTSAEFHGQF